MDCFHDLSISIPDQWNPEQPWPIKQFEKLHYGTPIHSVVFIGSDYPVAIDLFKLFSQPGRVQLESGCMEFKQFGQKHSIIFQIGTSNNNLFDSNDMVCKHFSSPTSLGPLIADLGTLGQSSNSNGMSSYEKWSNGSDKPYTNGVNVDSQNQVVPYRSHSLFTKYNSGLFQFGFSNGSPVGSQLGSTSDSIVSQNIFPPKSQVKRHKMVYHCKFGEFGVLEGQFTEPSGVAVNAQNDIIVADTNNHRIQVARSGKRTNLGSSLISFFVCHFSDLR